MNDPFLLKSLHIAGALALFSSLGAALLGSANRKLTGMLHGISLLIVLGVGFAMLKKPPMDQGWWMVKILAWLALALAPLAARRKWLPSAAIWMLCLACAGVAAWLGLRKPF